jgi:16S rRNA (adenine1518-N6/adenine1519-N6)-dimethyltransferase
MNLPELNTTALLRQHGLRADKGLGQNFLHDPAVLQQIARAAEIEAADSVLEIGPGLGSLTRYLALAAKAVTCVELDPDLIPVLQTVLSPYSNVNIIQGDILRLSPAALMPEDYLVVSNVPYYITSAIIRHLMETSPRPRRIVITIQKEVAERVCARSGEMSLLALSVQVFGQPRIAAVIPAEAFYPVPKVDSAVMRVDMYPEARVPKALQKTFFQMAKAGFSQKRKTLRNSLSGGLRLSVSEASQLLEKSGIDPMRRAETLSIEEWLAVTQKYKEQGQTEQEQD